MQSILQAKRQTVLHVWITERGIITWPVNSGVAKLLEALVQSFDGGPHEPPWTPAMKSCAKMLDNIAIFEYFGPNYYYY